MLVYVLKKFEGRPRPLDNTQTKKRPLRFNGKAHCFTVA